MIPVEDLSFENRVKWLTDGVPEIWKEGMNTDELSCKIIVNGRAKYLEYVENKELVFVFGNGFYDIKPSGDTYVVVDVMRCPTSISMVYLDLRAGVRDHFEHKLPVVKSFRHFSDVFFLLDDGTLLAIHATSSREDTLRSFQAMPSRPVRKISFPAELNDRTGHSIKVMQTSDGKRFLFLTDDGNLCVLNNGSDILQSIATSVEYFQLIDRVLVFVVRGGDMKLMGLKFKDQTTEHFTVAMKTEPAQYFVAVPEKQQLWILTKNDQVIRYSLPPPTA
jgi:hypothetical protein